MSFCTPCSSCLNLFLKASLGQLAMLCSSSFFLELLDEGAGDEVAPGGNISLLNWVGPPAAGAAFFSWVFDMLSDILLSSPAESLLLSSLSMSTSPPSSSESVISRPRSDGSLVNPPLALGLTAGLSVCPASPPLFAFNSSSVITSHFTLTASLSTLSSRFTSFSISGASTYFFFRVFLNRLFLQFFSGGPIPWGHRYFRSTLLGSFFFFMGLLSSSSSFHPSPSLQISIWQRSAVL